MKDFQIAGIQTAIESLIPCSVVEETFCNDSSFKLPVSKTTKQARRTCGYAVKDGKVLLYFPLPHISQVCTIVVSRPHIPLTNSEKTLLRPFGKLMRPLIINAETKTDRSVQRLATVYAFEEIVVAAATRGSSPSITTLSLPASILRQLQQLATERYEGHKCTSGFLFVAKPEQFISQLGPEDFALERISCDLQVQNGFTWTPAAFRYVDGKNSYFLISRQGKIMGIMRCRKPSNYSLVDRSSHCHLKSLLSTKLCRVWVGYVGNNQDVNVVLSNRKQFRWSRHHWHFIDKNIICDAILQQGVAPIVANVITDLVFAISDLRTGTVILIANHKDDLPSMRGTIDGSKIGAAILETVHGKNITALKDDHGAIGMLTSDGLTVLSKNGDVLICGQIIDLSVATQVSGGGRTQAASAASRFGLCIKVSEDGPISIFKDGIQLIRINY